MTTQCLHSPSWALLPFGSGTKQLYTWLEGLLPYLSPRSLNAVQQKKLNKKLLQPKASRTFQSLRSRGASHQRLRPVAATSCRFSLAPPWWSPQRFQVTGEVCRGPHNDPLSRNGPFMLTDPGSILGILEMSRSRFADGLRCLGLTVG